MSEEAKETADAENTERLLPINRRSYLKLAGTAAGSATLMTGAATGATTRRGIRFTRVVNMVSDAGCDPTGQRACDSQVRNAADDYTLLKFPAGTYKFTEKNAIIDKVNLGFLGTGDVRFKVPTNFNEKVFVVDRGDGLLFENIDIDLTASGATPGLHLAADDDLQVHDVRFIGQGIHPDEVPQECGNAKIDGCNLNPEVTDAFFPIVRSPDGTGLVRNVVAKNAGIMGAYSRIGTWIGIDSEGTIKLQNCQFEGFNGNGLYCSRTNGVVQVEGGTFRNNDVSQVRLGSEGSYVDNANIIVDFNNSNSPNPEDTLNARGIRFEGTNTNSSGPKARNCRVKMISAPNSEGGVVATRTCGDLGVFDTRIQVDINGVPAIDAREPVGEFGYPAPPEPHYATIRNVNITGSAAGREAIYINQRRSSLIEDSCIEQNNSNRDGLQIRNLDNGAVRRSTIDVTGEPIVTENASVETGGVNTNASSCPRPNSADSLTIQGGSSLTTYSLAVSGTLEKSGAMGATIDDNDVLSGRRATGQVGSGGRDSYLFTGDITNIGVNGDATVLLNGEEIDAGPSLDTTLTIASNGGRYSYRFSVDGSLEKSTAMGATIDDNDTISGSTASGQGGAGGRDSYAFSGDITNFSLEGDATVYRNETEISVEEILPNVLSVDGLGPYTSYEFSTSRGVAPSGRLTREDDIDIEANSAAGAVGGGRDSYAVGGTVQRFSLDSRARIVVDRSARTISISGTGSRTRYQIAVTGSFSPTSGLTREDRISGGQASGAVAGGTDTYRYTGDISELTIDDHVSVTISR